MVHETLRKLYQKLGWFGEALPYMLLQRQLRDYHAHSPNNWAAKGRVNKSIYGEISEHDTPMSKWYDPGHPGANMPPQSTNIAPTQIGVAESHTGNNWSSKVNRLKRLSPVLGQKKISPDPKSRQGARQKYLFNQKGRIHWRQRQNPLLNIG